jgi:Methyltransferase domain
VRRFIGDVPTLQGLEVLDLGCGEGKNAHAFSRAGATVVAVDCSQLAITNGRRAFPDNQLGDFGCRELSIGLWSLRRSCHVRPAALPIPVFSATAAPSLEASRLTETTQSDEFTISFDPAAMSPCDNASANGWLTSRVVMDNVPNGGLNIDKFETKISFVVTKQKSAGLKLNIVPISVGPQLSSGSTNTQSLSVTFDFTKKAAAAPAVNTPSTSTSTVAPARAN